MFIVQVECTDFSNTEVNIIAIQVANFLKEEEERFGVSLVATQLVAMKDSRAITDADR